MIASAGHPPPAVADDRGAEAFLGGPTGRPLGPGRQDFEAHEVPLAPHSLPVNCTDGLIEAPGSDPTRAPQPNIARHG
ncbi:SpoIIE family protein phosphatase [Streptomyces sp. KR55]|uniref:SpoIIE family protein phosphatase n=1 Tax=Streptomyces sp. KR55 TaxID=3457425 RepID=UPI003FD164BE